MTWKFSLHGRDKNPQGGNGKFELSFSTTLEAGGQLIYVKEDSVVLLDTGATATLVCVRWLNRHSPMLEKMGLPCVSAYPARTRFTFWGERLATDIKAGVAGEKG